VIIRALTFIVKILISEKVNFSPLYMLILLLFFALRDLIRLIGLVFVIIVGQVLLAAIINWRMIKCGGMQTFRLMPYWNLALQLLLSRPPFLFQIRSFYIVICQRLTTYRIILRLLSIIIGRITILVQLLLL
jgi:hypothetical protein